MERKLSVEQERERLARWLRNGEHYDPRNEDDYSTWNVGLEPIPFDRTWSNHEIDGQAS
jgi:hypothetical protein